MNGSSSVTSTAPAMTARSMPPMGEVLGQKAGWAIRTWLETKHQD
jgi:hypothetical protein